MLRSIVTAVLLLVAGASATTDAAFLRRGGSAATSASSAITSFSLVNDTGSSVTAVLSPVFGLQFKKGDIPSGQWPIFSRHDNASTCPYSQGMKRTWSDGSIKHLTVLVRCPGSVAGNATLQVDIAGGGAQPTTSVRTTTELSNAAIKLSGVGAVNLSGTWTATLSDGIASAKKWLDGDAGAGWVVDVDFKQSGTPDGQLKTRFYTLLTTDGSGTLGGIRFLPRVWQPYYDIDTQTKQLRAFSSLVMQYGAGPTTINWQWPYVASTFTRTASDTFSAPTANYYTGATGGGVGFGTVPGVVSTTGTLPAGLSANTLYYATQSTGSQNLTFYTCGQLGGSCQPSTTDAGTGTHTFTPIPTVTYFGNFFGADANAKWQYIQSAGSLSTDTPLRVTRPLTYWVSTKTLGPYDTSLSSVTDNTWGTSYNWTPYTTTTLWPFIGTTGDRDDIGIYNSYQIRSIYNQTAANDKFMRSMGYASGLFGYSMRQSTTGAPPNVGGTAYTGFGADVSGSLVYDLNNLISTGHPAPSIIDIPQGINSPGEFDHVPNMTSFTYRMFGTPDYFDLMVEAASAAVANNLADANHRNPTNPTTRIGVTTGLPSNSLRAGAWSTRELVNTACFAPDTSWDGVDYKTYFGDRANVSIKRINDVIGNVTYWNTNGYFTFFSFSANVARVPNTWTRGYLIQSVALEAMCSEDADATTALNHFSSWYQHVASVFGNYNQNDYQEIGTNDDALSIPLSSDTLFGGAGGYDSFAWTSGTPGTVTIDGVNGYTPTSGDKFIFTCGAMDSIHCAQTPGGLSNMTAYYLKSCNGSNPGTCNLAASVGGTALDITDSGSEADVGSVASVISGNSSGIKATGVSGANNLYAGMQWMTANGISGLASIAADQLTRLNANGYSPTTDPKWAMQNHY